MQFFLRYFICVAGIFIALVSHAQVNTDSLFKDIDLVNFKPINPAVPQNLIKTGFYIRNLVPKKKANKSIELIRLYRDTGVVFSRRASIINTVYGNVFAFKVMKEPGYEKVLIFADWDYHHDSLLIRNDTFYFKGISDGLVELSIVYPAQHDTITIKYGHHGTRYDFLKKFSYKPALKNYRSWFPDDALDYIETYTLVKKDNFYELIKVDTNRERIQEYEYKAIKEKFAGAGLSPFWLALTELSY